MTEAEDKKTDNAASNVMAEKKSAVGDTGHSEEKANAIEQVANSEMPKANEEQLEKQQKILDNRPITAGVPDILLPGYGYDAPTFEQLCAKLDPKDVSTLKRFAEFKGIGVDEDKPSIEEWALRKFNEYMVKYVYDEEISLHKFSRVFVQDLRDTKVSF